MNVVLWINSPNSQFAVTAINILTNKYENVNILGVTNISHPFVSNDNGDGMIKFIDKKDLSSYDYDIIVVVGSENSLMKDVSILSILKEAEKLELDSDKIILDITICFPGFSLERYKKLRKSKLSILSMNCWGGIIYHNFGQPFLSPTINMFTSDKDMLKFLHNPQHYINTELRFYEMCSNDTFKNFPVFMLNDVKWIMNHYTNDFGGNIARKKWEDRRLRINWFNLLVMMYTENPDILAEFYELPYAKKVCFVPFETNLDSGFYIPPDLVRGRKFGEVVTDIARGGIIYYDLWDMLIYGKKTTI